MKGKSCMRVIQVFQRLLYGDGVSSCILALKDVLDKNGIENILAVKSMDSRIKCKDVIFFEEFCDIEMSSEDIIIYHFHIGCAFNREMENLQHKKILVFHNVTPPIYFRGIDTQVMNSCLWGELDAKCTVGKYLHSIALSEFSKQNLISYGWNEADVSVIPLLSGNPSVQGDECDTEVINKYDDEWVNILFVGRIAMNKKIEDIITVFDYYQKNVNSKSRLFLVGSMGYEGYYNALCDEVEKRKTNHVIFTGHVSDAELEAYYRISDVFLCLSEHEGLCMPLIEAMKRGVPVIGYNAAAVPDTMGEAGLVVNSKDGKEISALIQKLSEDEDFREQIIQKQYKRAEEYVIDSYRREILEVIETVDKYRDFNCENNVKKSDFRVESEEERIKRIYKEMAFALPANGTIVVYGAGQAGKQFYMGIKKYLQNQKVVFCDNYVKGEEVLGCRIVNHISAVNSYKDAIYIITVQNAALGIVHRLACDGVRAEKILFFNKRNLELAPI